MNSMEKENIRGILGLSAAHLVTDIYSPVLPAILPLLILENGYPFFLAGLIYTVFNLTSSVTQPVIGWFYDKYGMAVPVYFTVLISAFFISFIGFLNNYYLMLLFAACAALGPALFHPVALGIVSRLSAGANRGRLTSYFVVGGSLGFAIGPIAAGAVVENAGLHGLCLMVIPAVLVALFLYRIVPGNSIYSANRDIPKEIREERSFLPTFEVSVIVTASAFRAWAVFGSMTFIPTYLVIKGFDLITANLILSGMLFAGVIGQVIGGSLSDIYGRKEYTLAGCIISLPFFYLFFTTTGIVSVIALILFGFALWSTFTVTLAMAHEMMPDNVGMVSGLMLGLAVGAGGLGIALTGYLADMIGLEPALELLFIPVSLATLLFFILPYPWKILSGRSLRRGN